MKKIIFILALLTVALFVFVGCDSNQQQKCTHNIVKCEKVEANCDEPGSIEHFECSLCGRMFSDSGATKEIFLKDVTVPKLSHDLTKHEPNQATCEKGGNIEYYECCNCKKVFLDVKGIVEISKTAIDVPPTGHSLKKFNGKNATCEKNGNIEYYKCVDCGKLFLDSQAKTETTLSAVTVVANGHDLTHFATNCNEGCLEHYTCKVCSKIFLDSSATQQVSRKDIIFPKGHDYKVSKITNYSSQSEGKVEIECTRCKDKKIANVDFAIEVNEDREVKVLQLTDPQIIDSSQMRNPDRLGGNTERWSPQHREDEYKKYIRQVINKSNPDLIIITGDLVYGEFDDNGSNLLDFIVFMDSFEIPWAPVYGNHDNESKKGVDWQSAQLENSEYCLFRQRTLTGNGNYNVGIVQNGLLTRVFYMMDSNGCGGISKASLDNGHSTSTKGLFPDQTAWLTESVNGISSVSPNTKYSIAFHIQLNIFGDAFAKYGFPTVPINIDEIATKEDTDFGYMGAVLKGAWDTDNAVWQIIKNLEIDSIFCGHEHLNCGSVMFDGVRIQYGQKSSTYDRANFKKQDGSIEGSYALIGTPIIGGTMIPVTEDGTLKTPFIILYEEPKS